MSEDLSLQSPPVKVLAAQLRRCSRVPGGPWLLSREEYGCPPLAVPLVWMQGTVLIVDQDGSTVHIEDESGSFTVQGADKVPKGRPCLSAGKYVMVMGQVLSCSPKPVLRAVKMTALTDSVLHRNMWALEVEDLHRNLS
ncbi:recQ-mediated genome instability protein 2 [Heteronotia binoei]|uniref:recQ-mediated genome instability protein 2 n=1 Tax=Heteronotia binoei TaxID=13085 RepID=UPI00292D1022|nr:recQ-mediated genome instability protein 2 [Heteronotia binoei]